MPRDYDDDERDAQDSELDESTADESPSPVDSGDESDDESSPPGDRVDRPARLSKTERDRRAREGRERKRTEETIQRLETTVSSLTQQLGQMATHMSAEDRRRQEAQDKQREAYFQSLPPAERAVQKVAYLEQQLADLRSRPMQPATAAPQPRPQASPASGQEDPVAYQRRRMGEIIDEIADDLGIELRGDEPGLDNTSEAAFRASARAIARTLADSGEEGTVASRKKAAPTRGKDDDTDDEDIEERVAARVRQELGIGRPNSPRSAAPTRSGPVTSEHYRRPLEKYDSKKGPKPVMAELSKLRDRAAARVK